MDESERLQRYQEKIGFSESRDWADESDKEVSNRIILLLNEPKIDKYCMVDAYYYDFSVIPRDIQQKLQLWRDVYLIYGITTEGEIISKWIDRWDLDSTDPIFDGKVIHKPYDPNQNHLPPMIIQNIDPKLLSSPTPNLYWKYPKEIGQIQDLINSFVFVKDKEK